MFSGEGVTGYTQWGGDYWACSVGGGVGWGYWACSVGGGVHVGLFNSLLVFYGFTFIHTLSNPVGLCAYPPFQTPTPHPTHTHTEEALKKLSLKLAEFSDPKFYMQFGELSFSCSHIIIIQ